MCPGPSCNRSIQKGGLCNSHYAQRWRGEQLTPLRLQIAGDWGSEQVREDGYIRVSRTPTPGSRRQEHALVHRLVMEEHLGRKLVKGENVHHINGDRADNRLDNLELWSSAQPKGQRVEDKLKWAHEMIALYEGSTASQLS